MCLLKSWCNPQLIAEFYYFWIDADLIIPSITYQLRKKIFDLAEEIGLSLERQIEMMGRAACELALQILGGPYRSVFSFILKCILFFHVFVNLNRKLENSQLPKPRQIAYFPERQKCWIVRNDQNFWTFCNREKILEFNQFQIFKFLNNQKNEIFSKNICRFSKLLELRTSCHLIILLNQFNFIDSWNITFYVSLYQIKSCKFSSVASSCDIMWCKQARCCWDQLW